MVYQPVKATEIQRAETEFRALAFHTAYSRTFGAVRDKTERFALAINLSAQPIREEKLGTLLNWYRNRRRSKLLGTTKK